MNNKINCSKNSSLWALSMPILFVALANNVVPIINTFALALVPNNGVIYSESVGVANTIYSVFSILITLAISGIGVVIGHGIGRNANEIETKDSINTCIVISLFFSLVIFLVGEILSPFVLFGFLDKGTQQYNNAVLYVETIMTLIVITTIRTSLCMILNSFGHVKYTIIVNLSSIFIDAGLTFAFVLGADIGVIGSSLGSIIASIITTILSIIFFNKIIMKIKIKELKIHKLIAKKLLKISLPIGAEKLNYNFAQFLIGVSVAQIGLKFPQSFIIIDGTSHINLLNLSFTIIQTFSGLITIGSIAFSQGCAIISSRKMGAKDYEGAKHVIRDAFIISIIIDLILAFILFFLRDYVLKFFQITNPIVEVYFSQIQTITFIPFVLMIFLQVGRTSNIVYLTGPKAYGNLYANAVFSIINTWVLVLGFGSIVYVCSSDNSSNPLYGINGIYIMMMLDEVIRGIFNFAWWKSGKWNKSGKKMHVKNLGGKRYVK